MRPSWARQESRTGREERTERGMMGSGARRNSVMVKRRRVRREVRRGRGWISAEREWRKRTMVRVFLVMWMLASFGKKMGCARGG
jgi:hypothetical protein